ncbi:hypothetical protein CPT_Pasto_016 [Rhizobium phage Pasto]|uniref:Uncharacterized protein n=1 Tax=Rhizobium phage Pasto TaxID=2767575 RepID=A0A7S6U3H8_9CAUD|nr:hypothetical protein CPT_Pasto_016 [Rhizobium phage Pasto]
MKKPSISLRFGASHDDITVDGNKFIRHKLTKGDFTFLRNVVIDTLLKVGMISRRTSFA